MDTLINMPLPASAPFAGPRILLVPRMLTNMARRMRSNRRHMGLVVRGYKPTRARLAATIAWYGITYARAYR